MDSSGIPVRLDESGFKKVIQQIAGMRFDGFNAS